MSARRDKEHVRHNAARHRARLLALAATEPAVGQLAERTSSEWDSVSVGLIEMDRGRAASAWRAAIEILARQMLAAVNDALAKGPREERDRAAGRASAYEDATMVLRHVETAVRKAREARGARDGRSTVQETN